MRPPPKHPEPLSRETRWIITQVGAVTLIVGLALSAAGVWYDWGIVRLGVAGSIALVGLTMLDKQLARDLWWQFRNAIPFLQDVSQQERDEAEREPQGLVDEEEEDPRPGPPR